MSQSWFPSYFLLVEIRINDTMKRLIRAHRDLHSIIFNLKFHRATLQTE